MAVKFIIEDVEHAETLSDHDSCADALAELRRLAAIPWDKPPNLPPCMGWENCGRVYEVVEFDVSGELWTETRRIPALKLNRDGVFWEWGASREDGWNDEG